MRYVDTQEREDLILDLLVDSYIKKSRPISSSYLCQTFHLPYSSATVRNVMESLEKKGFISHVHTSSGRVPTKQGFRYYVEHLNKEDILRQDVGVQTIDIDMISDFQELFERMLDTLANISGYTSLIGIWGMDILCEHI